MTEPHFVGTPTAGRAVGRKLDPIWFGWVDIGFTTDDGSDPNPTNRPIGEIEWLGGPPRSWFVAPDGEGGVITGDVSELNGLALEAE